MHMAGPALPIATITRVALLATITGFLPRTATASAQKSAPNTIPFVGCPADGQMGPIAAPTTAGAIPKISAPASTQLAWYVSPHLAVLAPRGWHCFGLYGSNGNQIIVTPEPHDADDLFDPSAGLKGPAVQLAAVSGGTSGRFDVARTIARIFPAYQWFTRQVAQEGIEHSADFPTGPYPTDILTVRSNTEVEFTTPANKNGLGTVSRLRRNQDPINGLAILFPQQEMNLVEVFVRLPPNMAQLAPVIIAKVENGDL